MIYRFFFFGSLTVLRVSEITLMMTDLFISFFRYVGSLGTQNSGVRRRPGAQPRGTSGWSLALRGWLCGPGQQRRYI